VTAEKARHHEPAEGSYDVSGDDGAWVAPFFHRRRWRHGITPVASHYFFALPGKVAGAMGLSTVEIRCESRLEDDASSVPGSRAACPRCR
jgi:hypothetical protein